MKLHANAKLGLAGRFALVSSIEAGMTLREAAACFGVSPATAHRWWSRWRRADLQQRLSRSCLFDLSSRPRCCPRQLSSEQEAPILRARRETNLGPARIAPIVRRARSTVWKVLHRHGLSRRPRGERQTFRRYEWSRPGALLHMDVKKLGRFWKPGHRAEGVRTAANRNEGAGWEHLHCLVDDHSRVAYVELHPRDDAPTAAAVLERGLRFFADLGCDPTEAVMTDNAFVYVRGTAFQTLLRDHAITHIRIPPRTPRWNGKVERFIQTLQNEWAYARTWTSSSDRARSLQSFIRYYNRQRPHSSTGNRPPISRVHNLCRQDS